jgi:hypothetical protein
MTPANNGTSTATSMQEYEAAERDHGGFAERVAPIEVSPELRRFLAEIKGQAQFLLYLADQIDESLEQLAHETDRCHSAFLCKVLGMYSSQLETKNQGLGEKIAEACQEVYVTVREQEHA